MIYNQEGMFLSCGQNMTADNWTTCPKCEEEHDGKIQEMRSNVEKQYGTVSAQDYAILLDAIENIAESMPLSTLREDYDVLGAENGCINFDYASSCSVCGFSFRCKKDFVTMKDKK